MHHYYWEIRQLWMFHKYVYELGILRQDYAQSTAIGLFQSVVNIIILIVFDRFAKMIGEDGII